MCEGTFFPTDLRTCWPCGGITKGRHSICSSLTLAENQISVDYLEMDGSNVINVLEMSQRVGIRMRRPCSQNMPTDTFEGHIFVNDKRTR